jgi:beta-glucosidase
MKRSLVMMAFILSVAVPIHAQDNAKMKAYIDALMNKMTVDEKIGQLNLPGSGDIVTGQASNSDIGKKIREGKVGGLFNIKTVAKIRAVQKVAVEESRLKIPFDFWYGRHSWLPDSISHSAWVVLHLGHGCGGAVSPDRGH